MAWSAKVAVALALIGLVIVGLLDSHESPAATYADFSQALVDDASCGQLFDIVRQIPPLSDDLRHASDDLLTVGCPFDTSTRMVSGVPGQTGNPVFPVLLYQTAYTACASDPEGIREDAGQTADEPTAEYYSRRASRDGPPRQAWYFGCLDALQGAPRRFPYP
jgi:hypothetical protein